MPTPLQVWAPFISVSPVDVVWLRDLQRAQGAWQGEVRIWLLPRRSQAAVRHTVRWEKSVQGIRRRECIVQSEQLNCITVYHVDEMRRLCPILGTPESPIQPLPEALYAKWLDTLPDFIEAPHHFLWDLPRVEDGVVVMRTATITTGPGAVLPAIEVEDIGDSTRMSLVWPPPGMGMPFPVSPEGENLNVYGALRRESVRVGEDTVDIVRTERDPQMAALPLWLKWPAPFDALFPLGGGMDLLHHQALMRQCIEDLTAGRRIQALRTLEGWVQQLTGEAESTMEQAWFLPRLTANVEAALYDVEGRFGLSATTLAELASMARFNEAMNRRVSVRRVHGWLGYFWRELYQDVRSNTTVRCCEQCGQIIRGGHADRRFCSRAEHPTCWRQRNAAAQRSVRSTCRSRAGHVAKGRSQAAE